MRLLVILSTLFPVIASGGYESAVISADQSQLVITTAEGHVFKAPRRADQIGFDSPKISPDHKYIGWRVLYQNCCTSYPVSLSLVILDDALHLQEFNGEPVAIGTWCFLADSRSFVFEKTTIHSVTSAMLEQRRTRDGELLSTYTKRSDPQQFSKGKQSKPPKWTSCVAEQPDG